MKHPTCRISTTIPSSLNRITILHKRFESFNHLPLKSHIKVHTSFSIPYNRLHESLPFLISPLLQVLNEFPHPLIRPLALPLVPLPHIPHIKLTLTPRK